MSQLGHLVVLDLTRDLGAYAGVLLAELGADVVQPVGLEPLADSADCAMAMRGKRIGEVAIDQVDIVLRGPEPVDAAFDAAFDADAIRAINPRVIDVAIVPFEIDGPLADRPATDLTLIARSGLATMIGDPDRPPLTLPGRQAWALAGIQGAIAALVALNARAATGVGDRVTVSAYRSAVLANYREPLTWAWAGRVGNRTGNLLVRGKSGVRQVWQAADGYVTWTIVDNPPMMRATIARMVEDGMAGELADVDWDAVLVADAPQEQINRWEQLAETWLATRLRADLAAMSNKYGMGLSAIRSAADVLTDPHLESRGLWRDGEVDGKTVRVPGPLFRTTAS